MSEIRPERDYPELSTICPNEMRYGTKSIVGNASVSIQRNRYNDISRLHTDRDVCKGSTDTPRNATQGCAAALKLDKGSAKPAPMATSEDGTPSTSRTPRPSVVGVCQFVCYIEPIKDIILGKAQYKSIFQSEPEKKQDYAYHEAKVVVEQLEKGNINFLLGVCGAQRQEFRIIDRNEHFGFKLFRIVVDNPSKNFHDSILGLSTQNIKKFIDSGLDTSPKKVNNIARVVRLGIEYLQTGVIHFGPSNTTKEELWGLVEQLEAAYKASELPEQLPASELQSWLLSVREAQLAEAELSGD